MALSSPSSGQQISPQVTQSVCPPPTCNGPTAANAPQAGPDNLKIVLTVSAALQARLTTYGATQTPPLTWDECVYVNFYSDNPTGWPVVSFDGFSGAYLTASAPSGCLIKANRWSSTSANQLGASIKLSELKALDGTYSLMTNVGVGNGQWFSPPVSGWEVGAAGCLQGAAGNVCLNSAKLTFSLYRAMQNGAAIDETCSNGHGVSLPCAASQPSGQGSHSIPAPPASTCVTTDTAGAPLGQFPAVIDTWCTDSTNIFTGGGVGAVNNDCYVVQDAFVERNCDQVTPIAVYEFSISVTSPGSSSLSFFGDVTYIDSGVGIPGSLSASGNGGGSVATESKATDGFVGYWAKQKQTGAASPGFDILYGPWKEAYGSSLDYAPVRVLPADNFSGLDGVLAAAGYQQKLATLNSYVPGTSRPNWDTSGANWQYTGDPSMCGGSASQTNPAMPTVFSDTSEWTGHAYWVPKADLAQEPWAAPLGSFTDVTMCSSHQSFYDTYITKEVSDGLGWVVCQASLSTGGWSSLTNPTVYVVMPYRLNFGASANVTSPNPQYVVLLSTNASPTLSACTCAPICGTNCAVDTQILQGLYWHRYWAENADGGVTGVIASDLGNAIAWGLFNNQVSIGSSRTVAGQPYAPFTTGATKVLDISMSEYYAILSSQNQAYANQIAPWIGSGLWVGSTSGTVEIYSPFLESGVVGPFQSTGQPYVEGYFTSFQDRIQAGCLDDVSLSYNAFDAGGYVKVGIHDPWTWPSSGFHLGDVDGSGCVDAMDIAGTVAAWGPVGAGHPADHNQDGMVNAHDLSMQLGNYGGGCP